MSTTVDREEVKDKINKFIKTQHIEIVAELLEYLFIIKEIPNKEEKIKILFTNPILFPIVVEKTMEELERHFNFYRVCDINNNIILVF